jgi:ribosomal protein S10
MYSFPHQDPPAEVRSVEIVEARMRGASPLAWRSSSASIRRAPESVVRGLRQVFVLRGHSEVERIAEANPQLVSLLLEAHQRIAGIFGPDAPLILQAVSNPDAPAVLPELFLYIQTQLSVREAKAKLEKLDDDWWLDSLPRADGRLTIALEYV